MTNLKSVGTYQSATVKLLVTLAGAGQRKLFVKMSFLARSQPLLNIIFAQPNIFVNVQKKDTTTFINLKIAIPDLLRYTAFCRFDLFRASCPVSRKNWPCHTVNETKHRTWHGSKRRKMHRCK